MTLPIRLLLAACLCLSASSCIATTYTGHSFDTDFDRTTAEAHIAAAQLELEAGQNEVALDRLTRLHQTPSLEPEDRKLAGQLLNDTFIDLVDRLVEGNYPSRLKRLFNLDLPQRLRVEAGIAAARTYLNDSERVKCFKMIRTVERKFPMHHLRMPAGDLLLEAGLSLAKDKSKWFFIFSPAADRALETLDYLVIQYPFHPGCDQAYLALAGLYESADWQERAITNFEDLVAFHPDSPLAVAAEARIPQLRFGQMDRADNDRSQIIRARDETAAWLARFETHPMVPEMLELLDDCRHRLVDNDISTAKFYIKINQAFGASLHAERARDEALTTDDQELIAQTEALVTRARAL